MPIDALSYPDQNRIMGATSIINDPSNSQNIAQAVATGSAVIAVPANSVHVKLTAAAATTGASLPVGAYDGQILFITITTAAANTVTFAAVGTSNVAGGAAVSMAGLATHMFRWDAVAAAWYQVGPLAN